MSRLPIRVRLTLAFGAATALVLAAAAAFVYVQLRADLDEALALAQETVRLVSSFEAPTFEARRLLVSLRHPGEYPMNEGRIVSTDGLDLAPADWEQAFREEQAAHAVQGRPRPWRRRCCRTWNARPAPPWG